MSIGLTFFVFTKSCLGEVLYGVVELRSLRKYKVHLYGSMFLVRRRRRIAAIIPESTRATIEVALVSPKYVLNIVAPKPGIVGIGTCNILVLPSCCILITWASGLFGGLCFHFVLNT